MELTKAVVLGVVQGLTEFLPVSSSGHLVLGQKLFGIQQPELLFDVVLHVGTLLAVGIIFFKEIKSLAAECFRVPGYLTHKKALSSAWRERPAFRMLVLIVIGSIPTGLIGVLFKDTFESLFASTFAAGIALLFTGVFLFLTRYARPDGRPLTGFRPLDAVLIGTAQGLAITPGISRSGFTISTGLFLGLDRELAARYSFLLSIPAILGALVLELRHVPSGLFGPAELAAGFMAAFFSGLAALVILLKIVRRGRIHLFAYYCWAVGLAAVVLSIRG